MPKCAQKEILTDKQVNTTVKLIQTIIEFLKKSASEDPYANFESVESDLNRKKMLIIDKATEIRLGKELKAIYGDKYEVKVHGEESFGQEESKTGDIGRFKKRKKERKKITCLLDPIDGTDLYVKKLGNWCTVVLIYTEKKKILGSFIGLPSGTVYFSTNDINGVAKVSKKGIEAVSKNPVTFPGVTFSWYGQKINNFLSIAEHKKFLKFINKEKDKDKENSFRILNISGNPLMLQMIDSEVPVNVIVELCGQHPHDMIPGAYLAKKVGATLTDLKGKPIKFEKHLGKPNNSNIKYILANSKELHAKFLKIFKS